MKTQKTILAIGLIILLSGCTNQTIDESELSEGVYENNIYGTLDYALLEKYERILGFELYYYIDLTCTDDEVIISFQGSNGTWPPKIYAATFDSNLAQKTGFIDLIQGLPNHGYPDHVLIHHDGFFYGAFNGAWNRTSGDLHAVKFDSEFNIVGHALIAQYLDGIDDIGNNIMTLDSPMISIYNETIYISAGHYIDRQSQRGKSGLKVWALDLNLSLKKQFNLTWGSNFDGSWHGEVIPYENGYKTIVSGESPINIYLINFDESGEFISKRQLIPEQEAMEGKAVWQAAHTRALLYNGSYYVHFNGAPEEMKRKNDPNYFPEVNNYVAVFNSDFDFERLIKLTNYTPEMHSQIYIELERYSCIINDSLYSAISFSNYNGKSRYEFSDTEMLYLLKYKITDESTQPQIIGLPFPNHQ